MDTAKKIDWEHTVGANDVKYELRLKYYRAEKILHDYLDWRFKADYIWLDWYSELVSWLNDNDGKGLVLYGDHDTGKSVIACDFFPKLLRTSHELIIHNTKAEELNDPKKTRAEDMFMMRYMKIIDNLGAESKINEYGLRYEPFAKVVDDCAIHNKFLIVTTNYDVEEMLERYGKETMKNLKALCRFVNCKNEGVW